MLRPRRRQPGQQVKQRIGRSLLSPGAKALEMVPCNCGLELALGWHLLQQWSTSFELCAGRLCAAAVALRARVTGESQDNFWSRLTTYGPLRLEHRCLLVSYWPLARRAFSKIKLAGRCLRSV